jgi:type VI secretion system protein ImpD
VPRSQEAAAWEPGAHDAASNARVREVSARLQSLVAMIDRTISRQLRAVLRHCDFLAMEARWRALALLVEQADGAAPVVVRVLDASWAAVARDLERAADFDRSRMHQLIYDGEFGMPGGLPFGLMVGDYELGPDAAEGADPIGALRLMGGVAASAFCPFVAGASPGTLDLAGWDELSAHTSVPAPAGERAARLAPATFRWASLRRDEDARFLGLAAPRLVLRGPPDRARRSRAVGFHYHEGPADVLEANAAFGFALTVVAAFQDSGWFAAIRGAFQDAEGGGRVPGFPSVTLQRGDAAIPAQTPVAMRLTTSQEDAMAERGVMPLATLYHDPSPVFGLTPSLHEPHRYDRPVATQNARLAAMLQYVLCTSRFAHYLKVIMRDEIGGISDPRAIEARLGQWLRGYTLGNDDASAELKAAYPLRDAGVEVRAIPGRPGSYACTIRLQPHFQLDDVATSFHLVAEAAPEAPDPARAAA